MDDPGDIPLAGHDKYRVIRKLGAGATSEVYLAQHLALDTEVVVKVIHPELCASTEQVDRMRLEAQALARLDHPHVVRVTDFDQTADGRPFIVMEFLAGRSLGAEVAARGGWLRVHEALELVRQATEGLAAAHAAGLIHRDIKLDNLFVCGPMPGASRGAAAGRRVVKLIDFGLAKALDAAPRSPQPLAVPTIPGAVVGTPAFLAPEQAAAQPIDWRVDIYSMGLVLYETIAGRGPFDASAGVIELLRDQIARIPEPPSRLARQPVPPMVDATIMRCLAKLPNDRFQTAAELAERLYQIARQLELPVDATVRDERPATSPAAGPSDAPPAAGGHRGAGTVEMPLPPPPPQGPPPPGIGRAAGLAGQLETVRMPMTEDPSSLVATVRSQRPASAPAAAPALLPPPTGSGPPLASGSPSMPPPAGLASTLPMFDGPAGDQPKPRSTLPWIVAVAVLVGLAAGLVLALALVYGR